MPTNFEPTQNPALVNKIPFIPKIALPTVFGEALSYVEELGRVVKACNQVIQLSNETATSVEQLNEIVVGIQRDISGLPDTLRAMDVLTSYKPIIYIGSDSFPLEGADLDLTPSDDMYTHDWSDTFILSDTTVHGEPVFPFNDGTIVIDYLTGYIGKCYVNKGTSLCGITGLGVQLNAGELQTIKMYSDGKVLLYKGDTAFPVPGEFMSFGLVNPLETHDWHSEFILPSGITEKPFRDGTPVIDSRLGCIGVITDGYDSSFNYKCGITGISDNSPIFKMVDSNNTAVMTELVRVDGQYQIAFRGQSTSVPHSFAPVLTNVGNPTNALDATNKYYVDSHSPLSVNISVNESANPIVGTMDKTFNEIATAITNGQIVCVKDSRCTLTQGGMSFVADYGVWPGGGYYVKLAYGAWDTDAVNTFRCATTSDYPSAEYSN